MRSVVFALTFLCAAAASAQLVSDEVVSDRLGVHLTAMNSAAPAVALAKDKSGVAIAWSMATGTDPLERVYVGRLDADGQITGVRQIPTAASVPSHAVYPSLAPAPGGDGFMLVWLEIYRYFPSAVLTGFSRLDASLAPTAPRLLMTAAATAPPLVRTKGDVTWLSGVGGVWSLAPDGTLGGPFAAQSASDMTIASDVAQLVGGRNIKASFTCRGDPSCHISFAPPGFCIESCRTYTINYSLDYTALRKTSVTKTFNFENSAQPAVDSNGRDVLVAWFRGTQTAGGDVVAARAAAGDASGFAAAADVPTVLATYPGDSGATRPAIANDGQRYLVVWRSAKTPSDHDIAGAAIDGDGRVTPFAIATSTVDERDPAILYIGGGTFLVAYEKGAPFERRIAVRLITFGRHRAAR